MQKKRISFIAGVLITLTSCTLSNYQAVDYQQYSVEIYQPLNVYPNWARAYIQFGENIKKGELDRFKPYCDVEVKNVAQNNVEVIKPSIHSVIDVYRDYGNYGAYHFPGFSRYRQYLDDDLGPYDLRTVIKLNPANEQAVLALNCTRWSSDGYDYHLGFDEINQILGNLGALTQANLSN